MTDLQTNYAGQKSHLFWLAVRTSLLTILTLGMYRFWMKTHLRRYYWSAIRPGGTPLEYVGDPWEKMLGFLFAVVILAFYIGVVNLILMFFSFALFQNNLVAYVLSFIGILPLIFFAQYRARRYVLARTRWRGIRFGLEPGAWGYAWRAVVHWLITIASLGLLWPRMTFWLEKYRIDRTYFGDVQMHQGGRWTMLVGAMKHLYIGVGISGAALFAGIWLDQPQYLPTLLVSLPWTLFGLAHWRAHSFRRLTETKTLAGVGFIAEPRGGRVLGIYIGGYALTILVVMAGSAAFFAVFSAIAGATFGPQTLLGALNGLGSEGQVPLWLFPVLGMITYFALFLFWGAARHAFVTLPLAHHFAETTRLTNPRELAAINQRARDEFTEAEGFADALDVGAAL